MSRTQSELQETVLIMGVGNALRSDDAVGVQVARRLKAAGLKHARILVQTGEGAALLEAWKGADHVIVVDAVQSGAPPGTIHRLEAHDQPIPSRFFHYSTHAFSLAEAIELGRVLNQLPARLLIYGVEGKNFDSGDQVSQEVAIAADQVVKQVLEELTDTGVPPGN